MSVESFPAPNDPPLIESTPWPHAPPHQLSCGGTYFVTASTYHQLHHFRGSENLRDLQRELLTLSAESGWQLEAWAMFSNHYHFVGHSPVGETGAGSLLDLLRQLHSRTALRINRRDSSPNRKVWFNFWETRLTHHTSYLARLNYTHQNPVRHGLVAVANEYPWCSAAWFERTASPARVKTLYRFKGDRVHVSDEYHPAPDW